MTDDADPLVVVDDRDALFAKLDRARRNEIQWRILFKEMELAEAQRTLRDHRNRLRRQRNRKLRPMRLGYRAWQARRAKQRALWMWAV